ncbi:MAG: guanylate kinase [Clostridiales bacterium]|nr:guanylate kinase [Clostridiales bacterium]
MEAQKRGTLFVFSGPSGVGKGTLNAKLFAEFGEQMAFSVSATTRAPREGEIDGTHYFFISMQEFENRIANNDFLEHAQFAGNRYGTPKSYVMSLLEMGKNVLLEIEVQGAMQVMERMPECVSIFVLPPSFEELERRLRGRGTETEEKILRRLETARGELAYADKYQYQIVNGGDLEAAYQELRSIYLKETGRV